MAESPKSTKGRTFPPEILTDAEVRRLIAACSPTSRTGIRSRALIVFLYRTGLRIAEALALFLKDVDLDGGMVRVLRGKGGRPRTVGIDAGARPEIEAWLALRARLGILGSAPGWEEPWSRARRCTVLADSLRGLLVLMDGERVRLDPHDIQAVRALPVTPASTPAAQSP